MGAIIPSLKEKWKTLSKKPETDIPLKQRKYIDILNVFNGL